MCRFLCKVLPFLILMLFSMVAALIGFSGELGAGALVFPCFAAGGMFAFLFWMIAES